MAFIFDLTVGGGWREPTHAKGEEANSIQKDPKLGSQDLNPGFLAAKQQCYKLRHSVGLFNHYNHYLKMFLSFLQLVLLILNSLKYFYLF